MVYSRLLFALTLIAATLTGVSAAQQPSTPADPGGMGPGVAVPRLIKFSGALKAPSGAALSGVHGLTIAIYKDQQGGSPIWMETQNAELDEQGRYTVLLGATKSDGVPLDLFAADEPRWLGVQVQLPGYQEESRVLLVSVPYALKAAEAETLKGLPLSSFVLTPEAAQRLAASGAAGTSTLRTQSVTGLPTAATAGSAGFLGVFTDAANLGNSVFFQSGNSIGLGTTTPQALLDVRFPVTSFDTINTLGLFGYSGTSNRSFGFQQIANASTADQYLFFNGGLGSSSTTTAPTLTTPLGYAVGLEAVDGYLSLVYNPTVSVTNGAVNRALTLEASSGRIGVGTTAPQALLDVRKPVTSFDTVNNLALFGYSGTSNRSFGFQQIANATTANQYLFFNGGLGSASTTTAPTLTTPFGYAVGLEAVDGSFNFISNPTEGVTNGAVVRGLTYQASTGRVGIGTTTPAQMLDVAGTINATLFTGNGAGLTGIPQLGSQSVFTATPGAGVAGGTIYVNPPTAAPGTTLLGLAVNGTQQFKVDSAGQVYGNVFVLPGTTSAAVGVLNLGTGSFLHSFGDPSNVFLGALAGNFTMTLGSNSNTGIGAQALRFNTTGFSNSAVGSGSLAANTSGSSNSAIGLNALGANTTGFSNTGIGAAALAGNTEGAQNTALGLKAGYTTTIANANTTGVSNTYIGYAAGPNSPAQLNNSTAIGANALVGISNALVLGAPNVNVGIGTPNPLVRLHTVGLESTGLGIQVRSTNTSTTGNSFSALVAEANAGGVISLLAADGLGTGPAATPGGYYGTVTGHPMSLVTSGAERMRVTSGGFVGIGTIPGLLLDVGDRIRLRQGPAGGAGLNLYQSTPAADRAFVGMFDDTHVGLYGYTGAGWQFLMDTSSGNVGVGGVIPAAKMHISTGTGNILLGNAGCAGTFAGIGFGATLAGCANYSLLGDGISTMVARPAGGGIYFREANTDQVSIAPGGNVGIGTTAADAKLEIRKDVTGQLGPAMVLMNGGAGTNAGAAIYFDGYDVGATPHTAGIQSLDDGNFSSRLAFQIKTPGNTNNTLVERLEVNSTGATVIGAFQVTGNLTKGGGSFKIDHPLDPGNKYLSHSFVESPDMMNIYNGNVLLDKQGKAWIEMPEWFDALNREFRYQLTAMGAPGPNLYVAQEIRSNRFQIAGGKPGMKVSWQVTGVRQDAFAEAHRIPVEEDKSSAERGYYLHPELHGQPAEKGIQYAHGSAGAASDPAVRAQK